MDTSFWSRKKILITGHTGFKGSWLTQWLTMLGAQVVGYALQPPSSPNLFEAANIASDCCSLHGDITDYPKLRQVLQDHQPEIVFHLAAQPLVRSSYKDPVSTFQTNVIGTVHLLEAARRTPSVRVVINVTSDKCYLNEGQSVHLFKESDPLGGHDPYSASKACAELVTASYRQSFYDPDGAPQPRLASVRAGNVIGGGDWAEDRLIPDLVRAYMAALPLVVRNPAAIRPWQHVLDPLHGYLLLARKLWDDARYAEAWNFGPVGPSYMTVGDMTRLAAETWQERLDITAAPQPEVYEAPVLGLDSSKSVQALGWLPKLSTKEAVEWAVLWYKHFHAGGDMRSITQQQIRVFETK